MSQTLLIMCVILGAVAASGYFLFRFLLKLSRKPVMEISLLPVDGPNWSDRQKIVGLIAWFEKNGFESAGQYACREIPSLVIAGFVQPSEQMTGVIYDHPVGGIWMDIYMQYADGSSLTVSNAHAGHELDYMPQQKKFYCKESSADTLLEKILAEGRKAGRIAMTKEEFAARFEAQYQKEMKWRMDRGGPTSSEVMQVAQEMGEQLDSQRLSTATQELHSAWMEEKNRPKKLIAAPDEASLPRNFQQPEVFRKSMEQKSAPLPRMPVPAQPVYLVLGFALASWCYYGYQYNQMHFPVSLGSLAFFFLVVIVLFIILMWFRTYHLGVRMCPVLQRIADTSLGAFLFIAGTSPTLFYARQGWIGKVSFREGSEHGNASVRLDAVTQQSGGELLISSRTLVNRVFGLGGKDVIPLPENDFSRKFTLDGDDAAYAEKLMNSAVPEAIMQLEEFSKPCVEINRNAAGIEIAEDLLSPRKEARLRQFLKAAETVMETLSRQMP